MKFLQHAVAYTMLLWSGLSHGATVLFLDGGNNTIFAPGQTTYNVGTDATFQNHSDRSRSLVRIKAVDLPGLPSRSNASIDLRTPAAAQLNPGKYGPATRGGTFGDDRKVAGIDFTFGSNGCSAVGWFEIYESAFDANDNLVKVAADFVVMGCGSSPVFGSLRIDSSIPVTTDRLYALAGRDKVADEGWTVHLDASQSFLYQGDNRLAALPLSYSWRQVSGPSVTLSDAATAKPEFVAPKLRQSVAAASSTAGLSVGSIGANATVQVGIERPVSAPVPLVFEVTVSDSVSRSDTDTVTVWIYGREIPQTRAWFNGESFEGTTGGGQYLLTDAETTFRMKVLGPGSVWILTESEDYWRVDAKLPQGLPFIPGITYEATSDPFATDSPQLQVTGPRGSCTAVSRFKVLEAVLPQNSEPGPVSPPVDLSSYNSLAIDFVQSCIGVPPFTPGYTLNGSIRINSKIPLHDGLTDTPLAPP